jgi:hypothetical protein
MVAGQGYSGVEADLTLELLEAVDESLDAIIVRQQVACVRIVATKDATDDRVEEEHAQSIEGAGAAVRLQEQDGRHGRSAHLDLPSHSLDVVDIKGADIAWIESLLGHLRWS